MLYSVIFCYSILYYVSLCFILLYYVILCYVMLYYVILCSVIDCIYIYSRRKAFREIPPLRNDLDFGQAFLETGSRFSIPTFPKGPHRPCNIKTMEKMRIQ